MRLNDRLEKREKLIDPVILIILSYFIVFFESY